MEHRTQKPLSHCNLHHLREELASRSIYFHHLEGRERRSTCTVAVKPATRRTPSGTYLSRMRTGARCAKRTQVKIGLTMASPCWLGCAFEALVPRAMSTTLYRSLRGGRRGRRRSQGSGMKRLTACFAACAARSSITLPSRSAHP